MPYAYDALRICGALYLLWLAWQAVRPGGRSPFQVRRLAPDGPRKLFMMGLMTNLLNPKVAVMYLSLLPQFVDPDRGSVLTQLLALGAVQITISVTVNAIIAVTAGSIAAFLAGRPLWLLVQRWLMGTVLAGWRCAWRPKRSGSVRPASPESQSMCAAGAPAAACTGAGFLSSNTSGIAQSVTIIISLKSLM